MDEDTQAIVRLESSALSETDAAQELAVHPAEEMAAGVSKVLELIAERLELEIPHPSTARRVRGARTVSREFVLSLMAAADRRPDLSFSHDSTAPRRGPCCNPKTFIGSRPSARPCSWPA